MTVVHEGDSDGIHTIHELPEAEGTQSTQKPNIRGTHTSQTKHTYSYHKQPEPVATRTDGCNARPYRRNGAEVRTNTSTKSFALTDPGAEELLMVYEADGQDATTLQTYRMDCLHGAPLRKLARYVRGVYQFDKFPVPRWSPEPDSLVDHLQPKPIMVQHLDNTIKMGHEPAHKSYALTKGTPIQVGLEDRRDTLQPEPAKTTVVVECPPETGIRTRDAFMKRINGHESHVASTIAGKDPHNTFRWKCASEYTAGQSVPLARRLHLPMQLLPKFTQALQTIKQEEENARNRGPYWLTETDYESLYIPQQQYTEHKQDKITSVCKSWTT